FLLLGFTYIGWYVFCADKFWVASSNMHRYVFDKVRENFVAGNKVSLTVYFYDYPDTIIVVVGSDKSLASFAFTALVGFGHAFFAHCFKCLVKVTISFCKRSFGIGQTNAS